jgi:hypothetical protein
MICIEREAFIKGNLLMPKADLQAKKSQGVWQRLIWLSGS